MAILKKIGNGNVQYIENEVVKATFLKNSAVRAADGVVLVVENSRISYALQTRLIKEIVAGGQTIPFNSNTQTTEELASILMETVFSDGGAAVTSTPNNRFSTSHQNDFVDAQTIGENYLVKGLRALKDCTIELNSIVGVSKNNRDFAIYVCVNALFDNPLTTAAIPNNDSLEEILGDDTLTVTNLGYRILIKYVSGAGFFDRKTDVNINLKTGENLCVFAVPAQSNVNIWAGLNGLQK